MKKLIIVLAIALAIVSVSKPLVSGDKNVSDGTTLSPTTTLTTMSVPEGGGTRP